jgi:phosphoenolpyruvate phosphomutase
MRASVQAMETTLKTLGNERRAADVDGDIAPVDTIFELVNTKDAIAVEDPGDAG